MEFSFFGKESVVEHVPVSGDLFTRLAHSEFTRIGASKKKAIALDGEKVELPLVTLTKKVRTTLARFLVCFIAEEVERMIKQYGTRPTGREIEPSLKDMEALLRICHLVEDKRSKFLQRVPG